jgi:hypothetical protein
MPKLVELSGLSISAVLVRRSHDGPGHENDHRTKGDATMRYFSIYRPDPKTAGAPPDPQHMQRMGTLIDESMKAGTLIATGALLPLSKGGARVKKEDGSISVIDGPFTESKELVAGWAILEGRSREHAIELVRQFLDVAGDGECELHQIMDPGAAAGR